MDFSQIENETPPRAQARPLVYVGPNMGGSLPMAQFTAFSGGLPSAVQARCDQDSDFAALIVSVSDLAAARAALTRPGSELARAFAVVWSAYLTQRKEAK